MKKNIKIVFGIVILLLFGYIVIGLYGGLRVTEFEYRNAKIPKEFDGYKIIQISDLHCEVFGEGQSNLIQCVENENPDLIVITGDMFDKKRWNYDSIKKALEGISEIAPIYAITGNNEYDDQEMYTELLKLYREYGVVLLQDEVIELKKGESSIYLYGMYYRYYVSQKYFDLKGKSNQFNILLYHDPSQFERISNNGFDLVLAGHTHGGIVRLPFVGGVVSNDGSLFPEFDYGMYTKGNCDMFVTTGVGSLEIPRFYNRPEIVAVTLKTQ